METSAVINNINSQDSNLTYKNTSESLQNSQSQTLNENSNLNSYTNSINSINSINTNPFSSQTITIDPNFQHAWTNIGSNIEYTNLYGDKIEEIKSFAEEEIKRIDDNIDSVVKLMKNAKEDTQAFNNLLQGLIGRKQAMVDIIKIIEKENNI